MSGPPACPACGVTDAARAIADPAFSVWRCAGCGLGRTLPPPAEADGREHFAEDHAYVAQAASQPKDRWWRRFTEGPLDALARAGATPGMRLLDVGCNVGYFLRAARARGFAVWGFDGSSAAVAFARAQGLDVTCARLETAVLDPAGYDVVVMNHMLEHLPEPAAALRRLRAWVRPDGFVMITLPNFASPLARRSGLRWAGLVPTQHVWHFTPSALTRLVTAAGFERVAWSTTMLAYAPSSPGQWLKWASRRALEALGRADNLILVARAPAGRVASVAQRSGVR